MNRASSPLAAFHLTGLRPDPAESESGHKGLQPALFSHFHDLTGLRYDFPMILDTEGVTGGPVKSLADVIDEALREIAPRGSEGEKTRRQLLRLEQEIRNLLVDRKKAPFAKTWDKARRKLLASTGKTARRELMDNLDKARESISCRGQLVHCDDHFPKALIRQLWAEGRKSGDQALLIRINYLRKKLDDILQLDSLHAGKAHDAAHLERSMGTSDRELFDFQAMSQVLATAPVGEPLPEARRQRIRDATSELKSQRFVAPGPDSSKKPAFNFEFENCDKAIEAFRKRLPDMAALIKAISVAELEMANRYDETRHDAYFKDFDRNSLGPADLALFPTYLVCLVDEPVTAKIKADIVEALGNGLPFNVLAQCDDILGPPLNATGQLSFGVHGQQLAGMALGLNKVFVMQAAGSSLYRMREPLLRGLSSRLPALFSVYSGDAIEQGLSLAPYLRAAAATESRAFPCFVLDPERGVGLAKRFSLEGNPQVERSWASHPLQFEDSDRKLMSDDIAFTLVDFIAGDVRHAEHFVTIPKSEWTDDMVPVSEFLALDKEAQAEKIPYTLLLSAGNVLRRAVVDDRLIDAARRCQDSWCGLQELGGINNSHALTLLAEAESAWQQEKDQWLRQAAQQPPVESGAASTLQQTKNRVDPAAPVEDIAAETTGTAETTSDDPWIETPRCTTCNECTELNNRMFAYNDDMQAYIADPAAGTYRELVEAAETCQVAIIHPGKARNPDEPDLEALLARAEPFM